MEIIFKYHKDDPKGVALFLPHVNGQCFSSVCVYHPKDCSEFSPAYSETEGYIRGLKDMLKHTGSNATGTRLKVSWEFKDDQ